MTDLPAVPRGANMEDCPRCDDPNPNYPWICPGHPAEPAAEAVAAPAPAPGLTQCPTCGLTPTEPHPRLPGVDRCSNCKTHVPADDQCVRLADFTAGIGYPIRCPHCDAGPIPPTHWTKHLQRHHPDEAHGFHRHAPAPIPGRCPACGRTDDEGCGCPAHGFVSREHCHRCDGTWLIKNAVARRERYAAAVKYALLPTMPREDRRNSAALDAADAVLVLADEELQRLRAETATADQLRADVQRERDRLLAELARLHEGEEPYLHEYTIATPGQWIWQWNRATPELRLEMAAKIQDMAGRAEACSWAAHEQRLEQLQTDLTHEREQREDLLRRLKATSDACNDATTAITRGLHLADVIAAGAPWTANHENLANRIRDALKTPPETP